MNSWTPAILIFIALMALALFFIGRVTPTLNSSINDLLEKYFSSKFGNSVTIILTVWLLAGLFLNVIMLIGWLTNIMLLIGSPLLFRWLMDKDLTKTA